MPRVRSLLAVLGLGCWGLGLGSGFGFRVSGLGFRVGVWGLGSEV